MKSIFKKMTLKRIGLVMALGMLMMVPGCGSKEAPATEAAKTEAAKEATADEKNAADSQASTAETINEAVENAAEKAEIPSSDSVSFIITLYPDKAPITCENFQKLVGEGFYNGISFHRVVDGIIAQAGDPTGTGAGGSSESIKGEFSSNGVDNDLSHERGVISMARANDPDSASSQFFICMSTEICTQFDGNYAAFGKVTEGMDVIDDFALVEKELGSDGVNSKPKTPITIKEATMIDPDADGNPRAKFTMEEFRPAN